jgi:cell division septal protein FtsQ
VKWRMSPRRWPRPSRRVLLWGGAALAVMLLWTAAPLALKRLAFFRVRQVELVGIRYLDPDTVLAALALAERASVFDDTAPLVRRVRALTGVAEVAVTRRPPGSLKVLVREVEPVALVTGARGELTIVDADSRELPFAAVNLDLPVVAGNDAGVVGVLARIQAFEPALYQAVDAARTQRGAVLLEVGTHRVLLARDAGPEVIQAVMLVARDLAAKSRAYVELDGRYAGQVVVRRRAAGSA